MQIEFGNTYIDPQNSTVLPVSRKSVSVSQFLIYEAAFNFLFVSGVTLLDLFLTVHTPLSYLSIYMYIYKYFSLFMLCLAIKER